MFLSVCLSLFQGYCLLYENMFPSVCLLLFQGYCLLYENMLPSVLYARDNWLRKVNTFDVIEIKLNCSHK